MGKKNTSKKKHKYIAADNGKTVKGKLDITRSGMGFVIVPEQETDVLIRPSDFNTAMHGDLVRVKIKNGFGRRMQGEIVEVLERKQTEFIGRIQLNKDFAFF
ncbi:MAG TPA: ribonuclease R, partial [Chitinophagaceae bacterium]|nr:ribonuclease R [Chitinophagaceae bacterium]